MSTEQSHSRSSRRFFSFLPRRQTQKSSEQSETLTTKQIHMPHPDLLRSATMRYPEHVCVIEGSRSMTFREVDERADRAAAAFFQQGLRPGDRVAVLAFNELEHLELMVATQRAGLVLVPLNFRFGVKELQVVLNDADPKVLIHGPELTDVAAAVTVPALWHLGSDGAGESYEERLALSQPTPQPESDPNALALLLYTSGTMGRPKGAMITNKAQLARITSLAMELRMGSEDVFMQVLPMFHLSQTFSAAFAFVGATNVMMRRFDPESAFDAMARHRVSHTLVVPTIINALMNHPGITTSDHSSLRAMLYGASPISPEQLRNALDAFGCEFFQMYGMTETGPATLLRAEDHDPNNRPALLASAGRSILTFEVDVFDAEDHSMPPGEAGEIVIRGEAIMNGYWNLSDDTTTLRRGWMHTGDGGRLTEEGLLYVTDRIKDIIVTGGENVSAREVEEVLGSHPHVLECAVIAAPDSYFGEHVHAVIVPRSGTQVDDAVLDALCLKHLASYKRPRSYSYSDSLPRNATGKILKRVLRDELNQAK